MAHLKNLSNEYQRQLGKLFDEMPKSVLAAIAVSSLTCGGDYLNEAQQRIASEWDILHANGIVPQKPNKRAREILAQAESQ